MEYLYYLNSLWFVRLPLWFGMIIALFFSIPKHRYGFVMFALLLVGVFSLAEALRKGGAWWTWGIQVNRFMVRDIALGLFFVLASMAFIVLTALLSGGSFAQNHVEYHFSGDEFIFLVIIINAGIEELLFRGIFFQILVERFGIAIPTLLFSLLFAVAHGGNPGISVLALVNIFLVGILFSAMYWTTRSLWLPITFHIFWNLAQPFLLSQNVSGLDFGNGLFALTNASPSPLYSFFIGGQFGVEEGFATTICLIFCLGITLHPRIAVTAPQISARLFKRRAAESELRAQFSRKGRRAFSASGNNTEVSPL